MKVLGTQLDLTNKKIVNLGDPTGPTDGANKQYVDSIARGLDWKAEVVAASTGNVSLTAPGGTLDGVTLTAGMQTIPGIGTVTRVLLKDQTAPAENGIYDWTGASATLTRSVDADAAQELSGSTVTVQRGTVNGDKVYRVNTDDTLVLGTTAITLGQVGGATQLKTAGNGLTETGTTYDVGAGTGITVGADSISVDTSVVARKFSASVGNGSLTTTVTAHGLGTADLAFTVKDTSTGEVVYPDVTLDVTNVTIVWGTAPASNAYRLTVVG